MLDVIKGYLTVLFILLEGAGLGIIFLWLYYAIDKQSWALRRLIPGLVVFAIGLIGLGIMYG